MFQDVLNYLEERLNSKKLAQKINTMFSDMSMVPFPKEDLVIGIEKLSEEDQNNLIVAVGDKNTQAIVQILGLEDITSFNR